MKILKGCIDKPKTSIEKAMVRQMNEMARVVNIKKPYPIITKKIM